MSQKESTHFGFKNVPRDEKQRMVRQVFDSVADKYDVMNDVMSLGVHRLWKRFTVDLVAPREGERILDLAGGSGDLALQMARRVGDSGRVILSDINAEMLGRGRERVVDAGLIKRVDFAQINAEQIPLPDNHLDCVTIGFGLRNVTDKEKALAEMFRVLKPGGRLVVLEFSKVKVPGLDKVYDQYSFKILPMMGRLVANDEDSYRYLAESIRMHPDQETLKDMMEAAGFERCQYYDLTGGIAAVHRGYKL